VIRKAEHRAQSTPSPLGGDCGKWLDPQGSRRAVLDCGKLLKLKPLAGAFWQGSGDYLGRWVVAARALSSLKTEKPPGRAAFSFSTL